MNFFKLLVLFVCFACNNSPNSKTYKFQDANNTSLTQTVKDTIPASDEEPSYDDVLLELVNSYSKSTMIDTFYVVGNDTFSIKLKYYCTRDNAIIVPIKYAWGDKKEALKTHNFNIDIEVSKNRVKAYVATLDRSFCDKYIELKDLKSFGTIYYPKIKLKKEKIIVSFNYSIPLSDIGKYLAFYVSNDANSLTYLSD